MITLIDGRGKSISEILNSLKRPTFLDFAEENKIVNEIVSNINKYGQSALIDYVKLFDGYFIDNIDDLLVCDEEIDKAYNVVSAEFISIIKKAKKKIWNYHIKQKQNNWIDFEDEFQIILGQKILPIDRVGIYVPGGKAAYPSSVLMNAIPAKIAGVSEIIMVTPPNSQGIINPYTLVAADIVGINKIYKLGGAQSIAALAFGIAPIPKVDKITGPGNIYVTLAKKQVYGLVDIDMIAGPSEVVIVADSSANPAYVAADLLSQAEHDPLATSILITDNYKLAEMTKEEIDKQAATLPKYDIVQNSLRNYGAIIIVNNIEQGIELSNELAPEHLELAIRDPFNILGKIKHAGSIFLGNFTPEPLGDYMAGPNHILPTNGSARFFSPLSVEDFTKKSSFLFYSKQALHHIYQDIAKFARTEGLEAHARSVEVRFK